jgi:light-regulated signal transduction histidine kinase (bacteriophytochrome)
MYIDSIAKWLVGKRPDNHMLELFIKNLPVPVVVFDKNLYYVAASDRFFEESPIKKESTFGNVHWYDLVPDMPDKWKEAHQEVLNGVRLKWQDSVFYRDDGTVEWWNSEQIPWYSEDGEIFGIILYVENITRTKIKENTLQETLTSLERSNKELSNYAHICAHDLNEPLRVVANCLQIIDSEYSLTFDSKLSNYFKIMGDSTKYMGDLIASLLKYCDHNQKKLNLETINIKLIIEEITSAIKTIDKYKNAKINCGQMPSIMGDKILLKEVVQNLISNALKYNQSEPVINIKAQDTGLFWQFSFSDNGIGIEKKYLCKIFEESVRLNPNSEYDGSGLGLYQCNRIINDHGGKMWVKSGSGTGSTFYFIIPKVVCEVD